jgi:ketosteroid isomerase-like protein
MTADGRFFQSLLRVFPQTQTMTNDNKRLVTDLFTRMKAGDLQGVTDLLTEDSTWLIPGKPDRIPTAGSLDKASFRQLLERMQARSESGFNITVRNLIAEGDQVACEAESSVDLKNGRKYRQQYHFAVECRGGKIAKVREYLDTLHVHDTWFAP